MVVFGFVFGSDIYRESEGDDDVLVLGEEASV